MRFTRKSRTQIKKLPLFLASLEIHCLTKKLRAFLFPNALAVPYCHSLISILWQERLFMRFTRKSRTQKEKLLLFLTSLEIHCLTKKLRAFLFPNALAVPYCHSLISILWQEWLFMRFTCKSHTQKKKLPLFLASLEIHCLTKKLHAFLFPNALAVPYCHSLISRNCITIYGKKRTNTPENFDSFAPLTITLRYQNFLPA